MEKLHSDRIEEARTLIMRAQWMAVCSAAATTSEITNKDPAIEITLLYISEILGQVADDLDPANLLGPRQSPSPA